MDSSSRSVEHFVKPQQICMGLHVHLDLPWADHPFSFQSFKVGTQDAVDSLRALGLQKIRYSPAKSDCRPAIGFPADTDSATPPVTPSTGDREAIRAKQARIARITAHREKIAAGKREFANTTRLMRAVRENLFSRPDDVCALATAAVANLADSPLVEAEVTIHLVSGDVVNDRIFNHALNVALLSMMVGREMQLRIEEIRSLGLGALLHDLGQAEIPPEIKNKTEPWTKPELDLMRRHCALGVSLGRKLGLPPEALLVIAQHHERVDGSGYPQRLVGTQLSPLARIVAMIEAYDELCRPNNPARALTPHEALAKVYAQREKMFDESAVAAFVRCLTVYPPGTIVLLSNGALGEVVTVNSERLREPILMVYDTAASNSDAILIDLGLEPDVEIKLAIRPQRLSPELCQFILAKRRSAFGASAEIEIEID